VTTFGVAEALEAPPEAIGPAVLALAEDQWFDRKSIRVEARDLADAIIAFGNAEGGTIVVGLWNGKVEGVGSDTTQLNSLMQAAQDFSVPPVHVRCKLVPCVNDAGAADHLLAIDVETSEAHVHSNRKDVAYLRVGDESRKLSFAQRQELVFDKSQRAYEFRPSGVSVADVDESSLEGYAEGAGAPSGRRLLEARGLCRGDELTIAGCLLFGSAPQIVLPEAYVRVLRYSGKERGTGSRQQLIDDVRIEGSLPNQILEAKAEIERLQPARKALHDGRFERVPLVPDDAWLEAVVNAVVHRSYSLAGDHTRVEIFDDRIEVTSPGRFPGIVAMASPDNAPRYARNPRIARVLADLNFGQELGEGIKRMFEEMRLAGLQEPMYRQTSGSVHVELSGAPADRRLDAQMPTEAREIVSALRDAQRMSTSEVADRINKSRPTTIRRLKQLQGAGIVEWVGNSPRDPRAYWTLAAP